MGADAITRYLCSAAYLDRSFRNMVIDKVINEKHKAIAPSYGFDMSAVAHCCIEAEKRDNRYNGYHSAALAIGSILILLSGMVYIIPFFYFIVCWIEFHERWTVTYDILLKKLSRTAFVSNEKIHVDESMDAVVIERLKNASHSNVTIYSGFSPFVGSGFDIGGWSFVIDAKRPAESEDIPVNFTVDEIYRYLHDSIEELDLDGLELEDRLFVSGNDIRYDKRFLDQPLNSPNTYLHEQQFSDSISSPSKTTRYYKCIRVSDWDSELVLSIFLRFDLKGGILFVEASYFILPPLKDEYRKVDCLSSAPDWKDRLEIIKETLFTAPLIAVLSPFMLFLKYNNIFQKGKLQREYEERIRKNPSFDYGADISIREIASCAGFRRYFQKLDKEMYVKILENQILDKVVSFLDLKKVDTSDLKQRQTTIQNNGVFITGGSVRAENMTVGDKAKSVLNKITQPAQKGSENKV